MGLVASCEKRRKEGNVMRKFSVLLTVLALSVPAMATVTVEVVDQGGGVAAINYSTDGEKVRAFALDITVDAGTIDAIDGYKVGESTAADPGYGIFPANFAMYITVDAGTGEVATWDVNEYTPLADPCDPGSLGGLGTAGVTLEMGGLWYPTDDSSPNAPPNSGTLCTLAVSETCNMDIALNGARGGVVLTDPAVAATVNPVGGPVVVGDGPLIPEGHPDHADWVAMGEPACWEASQCYGDADNALGGSAKTGFFRVGPSDLNILIAAWLVKEEPKGPGIASVQDGVCADFDRRQGGSAKTGFFRVGPGDLNLLIANWLVKEPDKGPGVPTDCNQMP
jgi:hypothetical protein